MEKGRTEKVRPFSGGDLLNDQVLTQCRREQYIECGTILGGNASYIGSGSESIRADDGTRISSGEGKIISRNL